MNFVQGVEDGYRSENHKGKVAISSSAEIANSRPEACNFNSGINLTDPKPKDRERSHPYNFLLPCHIVCGKHRLTTAYIQKFMSVVFMNKGIYFVEVNDT